MSNETITARWSVTVESGSEQFGLEELECETMEEWNELEEDEKRFRLQNAINDLPSRTSLMLDDYSE